MMDQYKITPERHLNAADPAFGARIHEHSVALPNDLTSLLVKHVNGDDAAAHASFLLGFPSSVADKLGMSPESVMASAQGLLTMLADAGARIPAVPNRTFSYGARLPGQRSGNGAGD